MDHRSLRADAEFVDCGNRLGLDGRFGADSICRRTRFLHAVLVGQGASAIRHAVRGFDRAGGGFIGSGGDQFLASGGVQEAFQTMLSLAVVLQLVPFLYVFGALLRFAFSEATPQGHYGKRLLLFCRCQRFVDHHSGNCAGLLSRPSRSPRSGGMKRRCSALRCSFCSGGIFLFCVRPPQSATGRGLKDGRLARSAKRSSHESRRRESRA